MVSPVTLSPWASFAVRKITGTWFPWPRSLRTISNPSMPGSITSRISRSNRRFLASRSASVPFSAAVTWKSRKRSDATTAFCKNNSSSTTSRFLSAVITSSQHTAVKAVHEKSVSFV